MIFKEKINCVIHSVYYIVTKHENNNKKTTEINFLKSFSLFNNSTTKTADLLLIFKRL